ncbi:hypothetical protein [Bradyrhizobium sp. dw_78]|uniref:phage major capsid protein n=1 Tax=Bradyrhizobium sp. dw_78 TaxID=2719793 RepID=UPI001BD6C62C|nr:hypothetical protein [Bradyrhizobium sp. dw_78]
MAVITTGAHPKALWPGIVAWWGRAYAEVPTEYTDLFDTETSDKSYEETVEITGFGLAPVKNEGTATSYDTETQGAVTRFTNVAYSLGYIVTYEEQRDNLYEKVSKTRAKALAYSMRQTKENVAAAVYNRAFNSSFIGGDGASLISASHPTANGAQSNQLNTAADLSEAAIEDMLVQIMQTKNNRGLQISNEAQSLIVPSALMFEANRVVKSVLQNDTNNNAINVLRAVNAFPKGIKVNRYLSSATAWFIRTGIPEGMKLFQREELSLDNDNDFDTKNLKAHSYERYSVGWSDWRQLFGTAGV